MGDEEKMVVVYFFWGFGVLLVDSCGSYNIFIMYVGVKPQDIHSQYEFRKKVALSYTNLDTSLKMDWSDKNETSGTSSPAYNKKIKISEKEEIKDKLIYIHYKYTKVY